MFKFLTRQHFLINLIVAIGLLVAIVFIFLSFLNVITRHNEYEKVPEVTKLNFNDAIKVLEDKGFKVEVQDSVWEPEIDPFTVLNQSPGAGQVVKAHRIIFLTVNKSEPPLVDMPNLVGFSFRNALLYMNQLGLKLGDTSRRHDIAKDAVLEQLFNGQPIKPGSRIFQGSTVSFVLGSGISDEELQVPDLFGMTYEEAKRLLNGMNLNIGGLIADSDVIDTANAYIFRQNPNPTSPLPDGGQQKNRIRVGQSLDVWISQMPRARIDSSDVIAVDSVVIQ